MKRILEIACFNYSSALLATHGGADRIELCDNMHEGGTTPSYGTLLAVRKAVDIPLFAMVRVRGGDFLYTADEIEVMLKDLAICKKSGCDGVVFGFLKKNGSIDKDQTSRFVERAYPMEVTFHRAFDRSSDPFEALEDIINCGCQRILTSGQKPKATDALPFLRKIIEQADDRIIIMPGSGIRCSNIKKIVEETKATEIHSSAMSYTPSKMEFTNSDMAEKLENIEVDINEIRLMKKELLNLETI